MDFLESNVLTEDKLAGIRAKYHIPDSVVMLILGPLESLNNLDGEVVFFIDAFKHRLSLSLHSTI